MLLTRLNHKQTAVTDVCLLKSGVLPLIYQNLSLCTSDSITVVRREPSSFEDVMVTFVFAKIMAASDEKRIMKLKMRNSIVCTRGK